MTLRINIGCGQTPTIGWQNYDNSISILLSKFPKLPFILFKLGLLNSTQFEFIEYARNNSISYGDVRKGLPISDNSVDVAYSSHMLEHLDKDEADHFIQEVFRILKESGVVRIAVPDLQQKLNQYKESGDADSFVESTRLCVARPKSLSNRLRYLIAGPRNHQWMYDGNSLSRLLLKHGFVEVEIMPAGKTKIVDHKPLDLNERMDESVYIEAVKPKS